MSQLKEYLSLPSTIWKIIVGIFSLGIVWSTMNNRIADVEAKVKTIESLDL